MAENDRPSPTLLRWITRTGLQVVLGAALLIGGGIAIAMPLIRLQSASFLLGLLVLGGGAIQVAQAYITLDGERRRLALGGAAWALVTGALLIAAGNLVFSALAFLLGLSWVIDGVRSLTRLRRNPNRRSRLALLFDGAVSVIIGLAIAIQWPFTGAWTVYVAVGLRLLAAGWAMLLGRDAEAENPSDADPRMLHPDPHLGLPPSPVLADLREQWERRGEHRWPVDLYWVLTLLLTFFAIHVTRMNADWTLVGLLSPAIATAGDVFFSLVIAYAVVIPLHLVWRFLTRPVERRLWQGRLSRRGENANWRERLVRWWLRRRMAFGLRLEQIRTSPAWGLKRGLQIGLPPTAVLVAVAPLLGISWYFNTETWATGLWDHWAAYRTDDWRIAMTTAVSKDAPSTQPFTIDPAAANLASIAPGQDFAFIVIGDTGEGDASQHILRDQYLALAAQDDVKFLLLSSDVIYPQGAMKDYEHKFYLPFKGLNKPIFAIPGNHDWYDALEAFAANFFDAASAKAALHARLEADNRISTTTDATIDRMIGQAATLRRQYGVQTGLQRGPYFDIQTPHFALIAVDTGIVRNIDRVQSAWLDDALRRSQGKTIMVVAGHPMYAAGHVVGYPGSEYAGFHQLLREHGVSLTMAGDTHDFEAYRERYAAKDGTAEMMHFVNGGGGAYLSIGTALDWPKAPPVDDFAYYPTRQAIVQKLDAELPSWKQPLWWWTKTFDGWPASIETLASAFASDSAPFYQSFALIRVEPSRQRIRVMPYGANGRLLWKEMAIGGAIAPAGAAPDDPAEFVVPMR